MFEDGVAAQLAADVGLDHQRVGFALADAEFGDVVLDVILVVVVVVGIIEPSAARRFQIVDPGQPCSSMKSALRPNRMMTRLCRRPADRAAEILQVLAHRLGDVQTAGIMIAAQQQHALASLAPHADAKRRIIAARPLRSVQPLKLVIGT